MIALLKSFHYAFKGFFIAVKGERNLRFHLVATMYVLWLAYLYNLTQIQLIIVLLLIALVISSELFNTAIELSWKDPDKHLYDRAGWVKDIAAAAVLTNAVVAAIIGVIIFFDINKLRLIGQMMIENPLYFVAFVCSLILSYWFVFYFKEGK